MLRLVMESLAAGGYVAGSVYHWSDFLELPIPVLGLAWLVAVRCMPPAVPSTALFWVTYALLAYQLVSFHDLNACVLQKCHTSWAFSFITLVSTVVFWLSMSAKVKTVRPPEVKLPAKESFPALKINVRPKLKPSGPIRLNMGESLQPKWV